MKKGAKAGPRLPVAQLDNAVLKGWITAEQAQEIRDAKVLQDLG